jgi:hypothetical protein
MSDSDDVTSPVGSLGRRGFLVMMGSAVLGRFMLPPPTEAEDDEDEDEDKDEASAEAAAETVLVDGVEAPLKERALHLLILPEYDDELMVLCFDDCETMIWDLETDEERAEAKRLVDIAGWRSWRTEAELRALLAPADSWIIRHNRLGFFLFLNSDDPAFVLDPASHCLSYEKGQAVLFDRDSALDMVLRLTELDAANPSSHSFYWEPVQPADAERDFRALDTIP